MPKWQAGAVVSCALGGESQQLSAASFPSLAFCLLITRGEHRGGMRDAAVFPLLFLFLLRMLIVIYALSAAGRGAVECTVHGCSPGKPSSKGSLEAHAALSTGAPSTCWIPFLQINSTGQVSAAELFAMPGDCCY